ncbi:protein MOS2-like [Impatiens glandulifera]|uniref:protein MOS2-like n=1 Tax=Impatiens glandulifera TaxID=253017 RepID=UPI001FB15EDD|nr:protein MOS2-like [Impatiens glandulifera]
MKLSFTKSSSKPKHQQNAFNGGSIVNHDASEKQFVTEFDPSKTLASNQRSHRLVIPPKENEWRPLKKMKNLELPLGSTDDDGIALQFEVATDTIGNGKGSNMSFGLNLRNSLKNDADVVSAGQSKPSSIETLMMQKFREDMSNLPDFVMEDYDEMPVEGFGAALLAGYGWKIMVKNLDRGRQNCHEEMEGTKEEDNSTAIDANDVGADTGAVARACGCQFDVNGVSSIVLCEE